jgi:hypothetical protein
MRIVSALWRPSLQRWVSRSRRSRQRPSKSSTSGKLDASASQGCSPTHYSQSATSRIPLSCCPQVRRRLKR